MNSSSGASNAPTAANTSTVTRGDAFWVHGTKINGGKRSKCLFCSKELSGGITRLKQHLAGIQGDCEPCLKVSAEIKQKAKDLINSIKTKKDTKEAARQAIVNNVSIGIHESRDEHQSFDISRGSSSNAKGPMDIFVYPSPSEAGKDRRGRSIMNLVVNCNSKTIFMKSKNASANIHNARYICDFIIDGVKELGEDNVVQIVTDNASNNMAAAKLLSLEYPRIFWTSCAAHTINLMLKDIGSIKPIRSAIVNARCVTVYIYGHTIILDYMRKCTNQSELIRPGLTRFATSFLSLQSIFEKKRDLRKMVISEEWSLLPQAESIEHKQATRIIGSSTFWDQVEIAVRVFEPLVKVLRRVDGDIPSMGWLYGDLDNAKNEIAEALNFKEKKYQAIWAIIDKRWSNKLKNDLHLTGYFLNPLHYYSKREQIEDKQEFMDGFSSCLFKMYKNNHIIQDNITRELGVYQNQEGTFGTEPAIRQRKSTTFNPVSWWKLHGGSTPDLKKMAVRVLSLTTSSSGCERAWSTFEMIHSKKRNRLCTDKLRDLVFVKFNSQLKSKFGTNTRDAILAPTYNEGMVDEWIGNAKRLNHDGILSDDDGDEEVFPGDALSWADVTKAMGSEIYTRSKRAKKKAKTSRRKEKGILVEVDDANILDGDTTSTSDSESENE